MEGGKLARRPLAVSLPFQPSPLAPCPLHLIAPSLLMVKILADSSLGPSVKKLGLHSPRNGTNELLLRGATDSGRRVL